MIKKSPPPETSHASAEGGGGDVSNETPMGRFKSLTQRLLKVPYASLQNEKRLYDEEREKGVGVAGGSSRRTKK
jgi:hypothetical protein